jgi:glycine/D-amino acid oxidase-like deaminating enzyme
LREDASFDFAIVGGGYTGLWTAWHLKRLEPNARIAVFDEGVCGTARADEAVAL